MGNKLLIFSRLNYYYRSMISLFTGTELSPNIFHPQFLNQRFIKKYLKAVANYAQGTMLDLGCGTKPYYEIFKNNIRSYYGLDALSFRKPELFINQKALTPDVFGDILNVPFKYDCIDTILCTQVIEHVKEPSKAVSEFYRILKKDGLVLLTCPQSYPIHDKENDYYRFTRFGIKYLFEKNGFAIKKIFNHGGFFVEQGLLFNIYFNYNLFKEGEGFSLLRVFLNILKVFVTPLLLLMNAFINILCILFDYFDTDMYFTHNYTIVAQKI